MKKLHLPLLIIILFTSCEKQIPDYKISEECVGDATNKKFSKIIICHHDVLTGSNKTISISACAWPAHEAHGDLLGDCSAVVTTLCGKDWMVKNLDVTTYRDETPIPNEPINATWAGLTTGAWCYYDNSSANGKVYGKLYNWYAVNDPRGLAPKGWHVPSDVEWTTLSDCLGGQDVAGGKMKETGTNHWAAPNTDATNSSGFTGLPGGFRVSLGPFYIIDSGGKWWSSTEDNIFEPGGIAAWDRNLDYNAGYIGSANELKKNGYSVRCVRD
jgi:uncharacterized protein (TIGR02145 family)